MKIDLKKWSEETVCPCCGGVNFSDEPDYQGSEIFRDYTCSNCDTKWTERYNLTMITSGDIDLTFTSEIEDQLSAENKLLKQFIKNLKYTDEQIQMISTNKDCVFEPKCISLTMNGLQFDAEKYSKLDTLEAQFQLDNDLINIYISQLNDISVNILSSSPGQKTLEFCEEVKDYDIRNYLINRFQEEKFPFLYDGEIDSDSLKEWALVNMSFGDDLCVIVDNKHIKIEKTNGAITYTIFGNALDYCLDESPIDTVRIETKKYDLFWVDPGYINGPDCNTSDFCEIIEWPKESLVFRCYSKLEYEDYDHCEDDGRFGLEIGDYDFENTCIESIENTWFETEEEREDFIKCSGVMLDAAKIKEYVEDEKHFKDLRNYPFDTLFYIKKSDGGEAEVYQSELWQFVQLEEMGSYFVNLEDEDFLRLNMSPVLKGGQMSPYYNDWQYINDEEEFIPLNQLVAKYHLDANYTNGVYFYFEGNEDIESFHASIKSFKFDTDYSIIATIEDMEGNVYDVDWNEIKHSDFDVQ